MAKPVINVADIELTPRPSAFAASGPAAERFDARMGLIGPLIGARQLGQHTELSGVGILAEFG